MLGGGKDPEKDRNVNQSTETRTFQHFKVL